MILPTKGISASRALLTVGAEVHGLLKAPTSVAALWEEFSNSRKQAGSRERLTFDWFSLALSLLFSMGLIEIGNDGRIGRSRVSPPTVGE
ncbi:ABC-three component system middle component 6 [Nocardioides sp. Leaf374]|uniref:ABC-three component system middle component 6 n=1 Tax=Nocardioides sp. Leaf374 TaxID=2876560 RepID=UPI001E2FF0C3|nr:ABC-three component system middle component 6 [Nocardioides sp. Leaf374]